MKYLAYLHIDGTRTLKRYSKAAYEQAYYDEKVIEYIVHPFEAESKVKAKEFAYAEIDQFLNGLNFIVEEWPKIGRLFTTLDFLAEDSLLSPETP